MILGVTAPTFFRFSKRFLFFLTCLLTIDGFPMFLHETRQECRVRNSRIRSIFSTEIYPHILIFYILNFFERRRHHRSNVDGVCSSRLFARPFDGGLKEALLTFPQFRVGGATRNDDFVLVEPNLRSCFLVEDETESLVPNETQNNANFGSGAAS